jgi:histidine triad (HIT) family protein
MGSIFTQIIEGKIPSHKILEDEHYLAFLEINPIHPGHTLVIPKKEINYIFDLDDSTLSGLMLFSKKVAKAIEKAVPCKRIGIMVYGLQVPHAHVHLVPVQGTPGELSFVNAKPASAEELVSTAQKIRRYLG